MTNPTDKDQVFAKPLGEIKAFEFNEAVTRVFRDMISRSVPGYDLLLRLISLYADIFIQDRSRVYDLGCSLGDASLIIANQTSAKNISITAVDNASSMIEKCRQHPVSKHKINWLCDNIENVDIKNASMVVLNLTLIFVDQYRRRELLDTIYRGLIPGGVLVLTEKIIIDEPDHNESMVQLHQAFKRSQGYSELEISQKRSALENVLVPDRESTLRGRLKEVGFDDVYECFRCFNFASYLAVKA